MSSISPDDPEINLGAVPPAGAPPDLEPGSKPQTLVPLDTLVAMVGETQTYVPIAGPALVGPHMESQIATIRRDFTSALADLDKHRNDVISQMWESYRETAEEIEEAKKVAGKREAVAAESVRFDDLRDELSQLGALAQQILMDYSAILIAIRLQKGEATKDPEQVQSVYQMAVGTVVLQEMKNPVFNRNMRNNLIARLDRYFDAPLASLKGDAKTAREALIDKWLTIAKLKMAFVAVAAFVDTENLKGRSEGISAKDILGLPDRHEMGAVAREEFKELLEKIKGMLSPEELAEYLDDMAESLFFFKGADNPVNQVLAFMDLFGSEEEGEEYRPPLQG